MSKKQVQRRWQLAAWVGLIAISAMSLMLLVSLLSGSSQVSAESGIEWPEIEFVPRLSSGLSDPVQLTHAMRGMAAGACSLWRRAG